MCCYCSSGLRVAATVVAVIGCYFYFMFGARIKANKRPAHPPPRPFAYPRIATRNASDGNNNNNKYNNEEEERAMIGITVVIMNFARPRMLQMSSLLPALEAHPAVTQILLLHANEKTAFHYDHPKVTNVNAAPMNAELGMAVRFYYCDAAAKNDWVIHVDDDMELDESAVNELAWYMQQNPRRIVGHFARQYNYWKVPHRHGYDFATTLAGNVQVVLTKILIMERRICTQFLKRMHLMDDMVLAATPKWNGEDIFVSLVANHYYKNGSFNNYAIPDINIWEADNSWKDDDAGNHDVSANMDRHYDVFSHPIRGWTDYWAAWWRSLCHYRHRGRLWATAEARLAALDDDDGDDDKAIGSFEIKQQHY